MQHRGFLKLLNSLPRRVPDKEINSTSKRVSRQFSNLFNSYAQAFNKENNRKGSLFANRFKRILIDSNEYLIKLIHYIHHNPVKHGLVNSLTDWKYSSYRSILSTNNILIERHEVIELFSDKNNFEYCHLVEPNLSGIE